MARNPCEDLIVDPPREEEEEEIREESADDENEDSPEVLAEAPVAPEVPFPVPFLPPVDELDLPNVPIPPRPVFRSAMREVTTIPDSLFITKDMELKSLAETLQLNIKEEERGRRPPLTGEVWFRNSSTIRLKDVDLFRWATLSVWTSDRNFEQFRYKHCGPHEDIFNKSVKSEVEKTNDLDIYNLHEASILRLYEGSRRAGAEPRNYEGPLFEEQENGEYVVSEKIRFTLSTEEYQLSDDIIEGNLGSQFDQAYLPQALQQANAPRWRKLSLFLNAFVYGDTKEDTWQNFTNLGLPPGTKNYYETGILNLQSKFDDYVFDAPVAFFEEETNGMLLSPFHSAKITKKIGNVDYVNIKGYENELQVPSVYHYYNALELDKKYGNQLEPASNPSDSVANIVLAKSRLLEKYESISRDASPFETPRVLKFPSDKVEKLEKANDFMKAYADNYVEISIRTSQKGTINAMLQRNKLDRVLLETLEPHPESVLDSSDINPKKSMLTTAVLDDSFIGIQGEQNSIAKTVNDRTISGLSTDIREGFFEILKRHLPESEDLSFQAVSLDQYPLLYTGWENLDLLRFEESIKSQIFITQAEKFIKENKIQRTYADILNGQKSYSEVVGYRIEKHLLNETGGEELIQTFLLMDSNEVEKINFIDSQIMPFKKYKYKIFTINLVIGTKYQYDKGMTSISVPYLNLAVRSKKQVYLVNAPFFEQVIETKDMPPMFPQVTFLPDHGVDDSFSIMLQQNYGEIKEERITIKNQEEKEPGMVHFKTDSLPSAYQYCRLENPPESYLDFSKGVSEIVPASGKTGYIFQQVIPNKYYYYTFRSIDNYDFSNLEPDKVMYSNPTEVYRVRMVSYANGIFMEAEPYEMYKKPPEASIKFERLLKISPSFDQTLINFENSFNRIADQSAPLPENSITALRKDLQLIKGKEYVADTNDFQKTAPPIEEISLGIKEKQEHKIWNKKFKLRIRSKSTGRAIDLNVLFSQQKKYKPE